MSLVVFVANNHGLIVNQSSPPVKGSIPTCIVMFADEKCRTQ